MLRGEPLEQRSEDATGPHHGAQKSMTTGTVFDRSITAVSKSASATSKTHFSIIRERRAAAPPLVDGGWVAQGVAFMTCRCGLGKPRLPRTISVEPTIGRVEGPAIRTLDPRQTQPAMRGIALRRTGLATSIPLCATRRMPTCNAMRISCRQTIPAAQATTSTPIPLAQTNSSGTGAERKCVHGNPPRRRVPLWPVRAVRPPYAAITLTLRF